MIKTIPYIKENRKIIGQFIFSIFFIGTGIWFIQHEQAELVSVRNHLSSANAWWVIAGIGLTFLYILLQALMYMTSFAAIGNTVGLADAIILFLKRNFVSVFLPAGVFRPWFFLQTHLKKGYQRDPNPFRVNDICFCRFFICSSSRYSCIYVCFGQECVRCW